MSDDLTSSIRESAQGPKRVKSDNFEAEAHPLPDQIAVDRYTKANSSAARRPLGLRFRKMVPPGAD